MNYCTNYTVRQKEKINEWLKCVGASYLRADDFWEYKEGQLLEIAERNEDDLNTWDEWQHIQVLMRMKTSLDMAIRFIGVLWENDIEIKELKTDESEKFYKELKKENREENIKSEAERLAKKYNVCGDDVEVAYTFYRNMIIFYGLNEDDAEEIVYENMEFDFDIITDSYEEMLNCLTSSSDHLLKWMKLRSGRIIAWCD